MAITSSSARDTISNITTDATRHSVHQLPILTGWRITRTMLVTPGGMIKIPNSITIHGVVRQRRTSLITPAIASSRYESAPNPASDTGKAFETSEVSTRFVLSPKSGSHR